MAGLSIVLDLLRKKPCMNGYCVNSESLFSATTAASAAASSFVVTAPFATWAFFGKGRTPVAYCDAGEATFIEDYSSTITDLPGRIFQQNPLYYGTKEYNIELKPLFSAFYWRNLALTSLRSFLLFYLPLLEPHVNMEEDDDDFLPAPEIQKPDLVAPFKKSLKQIVRDSTVVTTRRVLERLAVHYVSRHMACKLLKDAPKSAIRKAGREMPTFKYTYCVSRTTFRAHFLGILASWVVQVGIDVYRFFRRLFSSKEEADEIETVEQIQQLGGKIYVTTVRCGSSLIFASIGAGIGAVLFKPSTGQWIGCAVGDLAGPVIVSYCFNKLLHVDL